ncbi:DEAD/DEAH box helicase family protein [Paenarthrobacter sp. NPDC090522]|uniref:DEAD/DEAH box helicase family protein n=1 Tax=Paenarthrobacter sp. NPDC090522 TaxID=3364383 RepID=UPI0037F13B2F
MSHFLSDFVIGTASWQAFERVVSRLLIAEGFEYVTVVGTSGDGGADVLASKGGTRWLFQVKRWNSPVGASVVDRTIAAARTYEADVPVIVSKSGFTADLHLQRVRLAAEGIKLQLWDRDALARRAARLPVEPPWLSKKSALRLRDYQEEAVGNIVNAWRNGRSASSLVVLATGLGKTVVAGEAVRRLAALQDGARVLVLAHTNDLVYQLERSMWPFLRTEQATTVVNGVERPDWSELEKFSVIFASRDTLVSAARSGIELHRFDVVVVDECHHLGADTYEELLESLSVGKADGPFLLGLTATPWRPDGSGLDHRFDSPVVSIDLIRGLKSGFLVNVDYRIFTDNVRWEALRKLHGDRFSPKMINRSLFINQWDDAVTERTQEAWNSLDGTRRGIVFCGTIEHAEKMAARINALGFTNARPIYSKSSDGRVMGPIERNRILWDFSSGKIGILCAVDVLNEGVDVPDVNLVVFQRVTHSRRIFVQQLGRGLRISPGKKRVVVLDFVSDIRRFAAGLEMQRALGGGNEERGTTLRVDLPSKVSFLRANQIDSDGASFLNEWLGDITELEEAGEDVSIMRYPPLENLPETERW